MSTDTESKSADIVTRLRAVTENSMYAEPWTTEQLCKEAADALERAPSTAGVADLTETFRSLLERAVGPLLAADSASTRDLGHEIRTALSAARAVTPPSAPTDAVREALEKIERWAREEADRGSSEKIMLLGTLRGIANTASAALSRPAGEGAWNFDMDAAPKDGSLIGALLNDGTTDYAEWQEGVETISEYHATTGVYLGQSAQDGWAFWNVHSSGPCSDPTLEDFDATVLHVIAWCNVAPLPAPPALPTAEG